MGYFSDSDILGVQVQSGTYWSPSRILFYGRNGPKVIESLENCDGLHEFFKDPNKIIIGKELKNLFTAFHYHGVIPNISPIDLKLLREIDVLNSSKYPRGETPQDFYFQNSWIQARLEESPTLSRIYKNLVVGVFNAISHMENNGLYLRDGNHVFAKYRLNAGGRFSCSEESDFFNPHSVPRLVEERYQYLPPEGYKMILADHSAMEMRILAHLSGDKNLRAIFEMGHDIHGIVARRLVGKKLTDKITKDERTIAKAVGFLMVFGGTAFGLSKAADIPLDRAEGFLRAFFNTFPGVEEWILRTQIEALENQSITSLFGRVKRMNPRSNKNSELRSLQNFAVQSPSADINTISLIAIYNSLPKEAQILLHVHDGGAFAAKPDDVEEVAEIVRDCMENPPGLHLFGIDLEVPLKVEIRITDNWE